MYCTSHTEDYVKEMYFKLGVLNPEQLDFLNIGNKLGIKVFYWKEHSQAVFLRDYAYIFLNQYLNNQQKWQDFCHELGHVLLHSGNQKQMTKSFIEYQESKANQFMYHACVPSFMLDQLSIDLTRESINLVQQLFNVEYNFALQRLTQYINNRILC
ncbi:ImmA/IrrE family metallo-endopeptidase [Ureibacillus composti]|nr:ImmA/IrrE family metallo-endopeptidase [Ureibacillus composti]